LVAGVDEAGRGPLAGPVTAAAVILPAAGAPSGCADSKTLSAQARARLAEAIRATCLWGLGWATPREIDALNIHNATLLAMRRAVAALPLAPTLLLVDGLHDPRAGVRARTIVGGDAREPAIAAASILAKVARDLRMARLCARHPGYGFARHKGYPSPAHLAALRVLGPCVQHRRSFTPVAAALSQLSPSRHTSPESRARAA
jgi:ribonuclease HII